MDPAETEQQGGEWCELSREEWSQHHAGIPGLWCAASAGEAAEETGFESVAFLQGSGSRSQKCGLAILHPQATDKKAVTSHAEEQGLRFLLLSLDKQEGSEVTAPGKEQLLKSHALYTQTSLFQLFIKDAACLFLAFVKPVYLFLVNIASWASRPKNPEDGNLLSDGLILQNSLRDSCAPLDCCLPTRCPTDS